MRGTLPILSALNRQTQQVPVIKPETVLSGGEGAQLHYRDRDLKLLIRDNGVGIDERLLIDGKNVGHWGLPGMKERVAQLHGNIRFKSQDGILSYIPFRGLEVSPALNIRAKGRMNAH